MLLLMCAVQKTNSHRLSGIGFQNWRGRVPIHPRAENMGRVILAPQPLRHGLTAVIDPHDSGVVVGARDLRRVDGVAVLVKQQGEIVAEQDKLPKHLAVGGADHRLSSPFQRLAGVWVQEFRTGGFHNQRAKQAVLLVHIGK